MPEFKVDASKPWLGERQTMGPVVQEHALTERCCALGGDTPKVPQVDEHPRC